MQLHIQVYGEKISGNSKSNLWDWLILRIFLHAREVWQLWEHKKSWRICWQSSNSTRAHFVAFIYHVRGGEEEEMNANKPSGSQATPHQAKLAWLWACASWHRSHRSYKSEHSRAARAVWGSRRYPVPQDVLSTKHIDVNKHAAFCNNFRRVTLCKWLGQGTIPLLSVTSGWAPLHGNCLWHEKVQFCVFFGKEIAEDTLRKVCKLPKHS